MTIREFAQLCACHTQTLRYYDRIGLLKPVRVDPASAYRYYEPAQALIFVKIKNLQAADFTIDEIKGLLQKPDREIYEAFDRKIAQQAQKLERIREIQRSYLTEKNLMEQIIHSMTDYLLSQCRHPEVLREFGLTEEDAPAILDRLKRYLNSNLHPSLSPETVSMTVNEEVIQGQEAVLERILSLTEENLTDTILLNDGFGHETESHAGPHPDLSGWEVAWERTGWAHVYEFLEELPPLTPEYDYGLWVKTPAADMEDLSFPLFLLGAVLYRQAISDIAVNCAGTEATDGQTHFKLLRRRAQG